MKIIQLIYSLASGGAERFVVSLSNQLAEMGHDVQICIMLSSNDNKNVFNSQYLTSGIKLHSFGFDRGFSIAKLRTVEKFILEYKPDVVHCHLNVIPYIYRLSLIRKDIRFIHTIHNMAENAVGKSWQKVVNRFFYGKSLILPVTISDKCRLSYMQYYRLGAPDSIDNGCVLPQKSPSFQDVANEVSSYKRTHNTRVMIHVARFHAQKNQSMLIDIYNKLEKSGLDFLLLILGEGFDSGDGLQLKKKAGERIYFLGVKSNVADYLMCSDAFCLTSIYEGLPISLLEALACGVTPICTNVGGIPDVIKDGINGYLSECTPESYISAIQRYINGNIQKETLKAYFAKHYSIALCAERYVNVYSKL
jgi:glycosyltransferase involved in cell wall biosynthesis